MEQEEQSGNIWEKFLNTELPTKSSEYLDSVGEQLQPDEITSQSGQSKSTVDRSAQYIAIINFYFNTSTRKLFSYTFNKTHSQDVQQYIPHATRIGKVKEFEIQNVTDLENLVKEYQSQLDYRGVRFHALDMIELGNEKNDKLFPHDYGITSGLGNEINGIIEHLKQDYDQR